MPSSSILTIRVILQWVFRPTKPYNMTACFSGFSPNGCYFPHQIWPSVQPAPPPAYPARQPLQALIMGDFPLTRYKVCFIARTRGSRAAFRIMSTIGSKIRRDDAAGYPFLLWLQRYPFHQQGLLGSAGYRAYTLILQTL